MNNFIKVEKTAVDVVYRILTKRLAKGYTAEQVSGIICREPGYITAVELLQIPLYSDYELQEIAWALGEQEIDGFFPKLKQSGLLNVHMEKEIYGNTCIHSCDIITEDGKEVPFFFLQEELSGSGVNLPN
ncbi:hypothetical protein [Pedobacter hartonius]|uniref:Uncharacterized protein n=1 Tax=Pedobacter hartonius TaxID=425514 RepID=A0A1H3ZJ10_9SPHI|nr:hypothetical protein [Pedobacter hartonius]SEA23657.1 hypothetical protein SAMN05443550_102378 [Pedobacter hartonius]